ncbi:unnamed protein product [Rhizopus stolonifer]
MEDIDSAFDFNFDDIDFDIPSTEPNLAASGQSSPPLRPSTSFTETPKEPESQKPKKKKLDHNLLLSKEGLPRLMSEASFLNFGGRGHEERNLQKLMRYYQLWANTLFPKLLFKDFAQKVGTPATHKTVRERIGVWQDEYRDRHMIRAEVQTADKSSSEEEEDEDTYNQILLDSVFPVSSNEKARTPSPSGDMVEDKEEEGSVEQTTPNRSDALTILAEQRRKRNLAASNTNETKENTAKKAKIDTNATKKDQQFIEFSDSDDEQPTFTRKRRMIRQESEEEEEEEDALEKAKIKFKQFTETDIDLSEISVIEDIQMEDIGDTQLDEE